MESILQVWRDGALHLRDSDPRLAPHILRLGPPTLKLTRTPYRALVESIISQQISPRAADGITRKFVDLYAGFPRPEDVLATRLPKLRSAGLSRAKALYIRDLSARWAEFPQRRAGWDKLEDTEILRRLVEVKGIGEWTAHMFLMFCLGRPDILPVGDYGIQRGLQTLLDLPAVPKPKEIPTLVAHWAGVRSVGCWYLWRVLDTKTTASP